MKKKIIVSVVIIICIALGIWGYRMHLNVGQAQTGGGGTTDNAVKYFDSKKNYRYQTIDLKIDNSKTEKEVKYAITNPNGKILAEGKVNAGEKFSIPKIKEKGIKGTWRIELTKEVNEDVDESEDTVKFDYDFTAGNKQKMKKIFSK